MSKEEALKKLYAETYPDREVLARTMKGNIQKFKVGYFLKKFGSIVIVKKKNGKRFAYV